MNRLTSGLYGWWRELLGAILVFASRVAIAPRTFWEHDELLFAQGVESFEPLRFHPHPPGYPLYILLGKFVNLFVHDIFTSLVWISIVSCVVGFLALARLFRHLIDDADLAVAAALLVYFAAAMLVHSVLPMSDSASFAMVALTLLAVVHLRDETHERAAILTGVAASCAIGLRPQLLVPLAPVLLLALIEMRRLKQRIASVLAFAFISFLWFLPLVDAAGGFESLVAWERKQVDYVAVHDAAVSRGLYSAGGIFTRFVIHPWGSKYVTLPLLFFLAFGLVEIVRRRNRRMLPLVIFTLVQLAFELRSMDPADGARYSIPILPLFALVAVCGLGVIQRSAQLRLIPWLGVALIGGLSLWYVSPIVRARTTGASPPVTAAGYAVHALAPNTVILFDWSVRPHADVLFARFHPMQVEAGLRALYDRPDVPVVLFSNGGSRDAEAKTFSWPPSDAYGKLTRNFYRVVSLEPIPPSRRYLPLRGVYALERTNEGESWRWLAKESEIRLPRAHGSSAKLSFMLGPDAPFETNDIAMFVNGAEAGKVSARRGEVTVGEVSLPAGPVDLRLVAAHAFSPDAIIHNGDLRTLSTQLTGLQLN